MNDTSSLNNNQPEAYDRREARQQRREARHEALSTTSGGLVAGLVLIVLGAIFLFQNLGTYTFPLHNWWALFILIPAVASFEKAWRIYRAEGNQLTRPARGPLFGGLVLTLIASAFLFQFSWAWIGPGFLILAGVSVLLNAQN